MYWNTNDRPASTDVVAAGNGEALTEMETQVVARQIKSQAHEKADAKANPTKPQATAEDDALPPPEAGGALIEVSSKVSPKEVTKAAEERALLRRAEEERAAHAREEARLLFVEPDKDTPDQLHAFLLANPLTVPAFVNSILTDGEHADWLGEAVKATPELAELTDADGHHAFAFAHLRCKQACTHYSNVRR